MSTPAEVVAEAFALAQSYVASAQSQLSSFTAALDAAIQVAPTLDVTWAPINDPGTSTVGPYTPPADYTSDLDGDAMFEAAKTNITTRIAGGTGIDPAVETQIWDRARERELATRTANIDQASRDAESLGWGLPPGVLVDSVARETRAYHDGAATFARDVAIKQADLEQSNVQKATEQAIAAYNSAVAFEQMLADVIAKRAQVSLDAFRAEVERFVAEVTQDVKHWEVQVKQYEAMQNYSLQAGRINAEIVRGNLNANLEAAKVGAQVYAQLVAAAYNLINASASVSGSSSTSVGYSYSNDTLDSPPALTSI